MAEYIKRETVLADELTYCLPYSVGKAAGRVVVFAEDIEAIPAEDVVTVVHGKWVGLEYDGYADGCPVYDLWECSECGVEERGEDVPTTHPWCHGCGARMDGE